MQKQSEHEGRGEKKEGDREIRKILEWRGRRGKRKGNVIKGETKIVM